MRLGMRWIPWLMAMGTAALWGQEKATVTKKPFGQTPEGAKVEMYTLANGKLEAAIISYGAIVVSLKTPDRNGKMADVVLGYDTLDGYIAGAAHFGAVVGRYGNRIAHGKFALDGHEYTLALNDGANHLHGGVKGFDRVVWKGREIPGGVELTYLSKDGEEGYPGNLTAAVTYTLLPDGLRIDYRATTDKDTVVNLTNHSYFNLKGAGEGDILDHVVTIAADRFNPVDAGLIPTGELQQVAGTPFDFRKPHRIGERIGENEEQLRLGKGYDHNWVLNNGGGKLALAARATEPANGRTLEVYTTQPGLQFYTGNMLSGKDRGKGGKIYPWRGAFCMETQRFPDSPNHPAFPTTELKPGQIYKTTTEFRFSAK